MVTQTFKINIVPNGLTPRVAVDQYDTGLRTLVAQVYEGTERLVLTDGYTYTIVGTKPSGTGFSYEATVENGDVVIDVTGQMTVVAGPVLCGIIVTDNNGGRVGTHNFYLDVQPAALKSDTIIDSDDFGSIITDAVAEYMEEHGIVIDPTLTVAGAAADAKVTGDEIDELKSNLSVQLGDTKNSFFDPNNVNKINAYINGSNVIKASANDRLAWVKLSKNKTYRLFIPKKSNTDAVVILCKEAPAIDVAGINKYTVSSSQEFLCHVFTTDSEYVYAVIKYFNTTSTRYTENDVLNSITIVEVTTYNDKITSLIGGHFDANLFRIGSIYQGTYSDAAVYSHRVCAQNILTFPYDITVSAASGYRYFLSMFDETGVFSRDTSWSDGVTLIPAHTQFKIVISTDPEGNGVPPIVDYVKSIIVKIGSEINTAGKYDELNTQVDNARHILENGTSPLTLIHFSDIHEDEEALQRITKEASNIVHDDAICTGDMVGNTYQQISSWWDSSVMTCVGNHDTASYNSSTGYNWTALSMANRDAYYIAPFESNWSITHTSGTSYYYKDYATQKVRLIVMDGMLYTNNGAEATAQTAWLENLLSDAITNNLHVIIAIHAPHGGATAEDCSFSRYAQSAMPTNSDCNTPQTVIDTVAAKITAGLKFIGYLCGHTHQDNVWDAENDGKQLMYCVTTANTKQKAQWVNSDQDRSKCDAYNVVTIDTTRTLVKIVRGGGADIDDHMRTRKAICFNYSTGQMVGEVL